MLRVLRGFLFVSTMISLVLIFMFFVPASHGAEYPKTVQIINPFPPGAITDILARLLSDKVASILGQSVVVINKSGAGGAVGISAVKDAPADGYTVLIAPPPIALIPLVRKGIGFAPSDFNPVNLIGTTPAVMIECGENAGSSVPI